MDEVYGNWSPRTDLAIEISTSLKEGHDKDYEIEGVEVQTKVNEEFDITTTHVVVKNDAGEKKMGKPIGTYITIECPSMGENDPACHEAIMNMLALELGNLLPKNNTKGDNEAFKDRSILVIGLGNRFATPDTLGPKVAGKVLVTRHLKEKVPDAIDEGVSSLSSLAPGVMGLTGIETSEIVHGVAKNIKPDCIIAIDALAARNAKRINATIQISDTGISPGAGVGNKRKGINQETVGCPVIAIGVPTVVDAATLVNDTLDHLIEAMLKEAEHSPLYDMLKDLGKQEKYNLVRETLFPYIGDLFVTPKDIDEVMEYLANIIANGINIAVHPGITLEDINRYSY
ncbi:MAG: GPR endopeptidase [Cellulosilyticaceae bacterium]